MLPKELRLPRSRSCELQGGRSDDVGYHMFLQQTRQPLLYHKPAFAAWIVIFLVFVLSS